MNFSLVLEVNILGTVVMFCSLHFNGFVPSTTSMAMAVLPRTGRRVPMLDPFKDGSSEGRVGSCVDCRIRASAGGSSA